MPAGHAKHVDTELEPAVDDVPAGHAVHADSTLVGATRLPYLPSGQSLHVAVDSFEYFPVGHATHCDNAVAPVPPAYIP